LKQEEMVRILRTSKGVLRFTKAGGTEIRPLLEHKNYNLENVYNNHNAD